MYLVLGLGNPGRRYDRTRHNVGFRVVDRLAARYRETCDRPHLGSLVGRLRIGEHDVAIAKPQAFMNLSGQPAASLRGYYKVELTDLIVVHDEVDLPFGVVRIKVGGGHGGHNGVRDLLARLGDPGFVRVRVGVSRPPPPWDTADYVLSAWTSAEEAELPRIVDAAADAVEAIVREGVQRAMNHVNQRPDPGPGPAPAT
jgi:PTH1 family peptidyl-tRNA hydrolase